MPPSRLRGVRRSSAIREVFTRQNGTHAGSPTHDNKVQNRASCQLSCYDGCCWPCGCASPSSRRPRPLPITLHTRLPSPQPGRHNATMRPLPVTPRTRRARAQSWSGAARCHPAARRSTARRSRSTRARSGCSGSRACMTSRLNPRRPDFQVSVHAAWGQCRVVLSVSCRVLIRDRCQLYWRGPCQHADRGNHRSPLPDLIIFMPGCLDTLPHSDSPVLELYRMAGSPTHRHPTNLDPCPSRIGYSAARRR